MIRSWFQNLSLRRKMTVGILLTGGLTLLAVGGAFAAREFGAFRQTLVQQMTVLTKGLAFNVALFVEFGTPSDTVKLMDDTSKDYLTSMANTLKGFSLAELDVVQGVYRDGKLWAKLPLQAPDEFFPPTPSNQRHQFDGTYLLVWEPIVNKENQPLGTFLLKVNLEPFYARFWNSMLFMMALLLAAAALAGVVSARILALITRPILELSQTARRVSERQDYSLRATAGSRDEVGVLIGAFNEMLGRIETANQELKHSHDQLADYSQTLEQKVAERTAALSAATTAAREAQGAAERANRAKSLFLANMSHEIRTPLNAVLGYAQILRRDQDILPRHREAIETIERSGDHLLEMINDILDLSKIEAGRMELRPADFDLRALIQGLAAMFKIRCEQKGLAWRTEFLSVECGARSEAEKEKGRKGEEGNADVSEQVGERVSGKDTGNAGASHFLTHPPAHSHGSLPLRGDEGKLRQVLINLLGNAVKFTERGGVTLRVSHVPPGTGARASSPAAAPEVKRPTPNDAAEPGARASSPAAATDFERGADSTLPDSTAPGLRAKTPALRYRFEVIDTGVGIAPELAADLFQPFQQGAEGIKHGGAGLGLALSRRHLELMGSELKSESVVGQGARFYFDLELQSAGTEFIIRPERAARQVIRLAPGSAVKALIVDDVAENRKVLAWMLSSLGCEVAEAANGLDALALVAQFNPAIVFMDIRMPGMDGQETARRIRSDPARQGLRIVTITASALAHEEERYRQVGFDDFIAKPFRFEKVCDCLKGLLQVEFEYAETEPPAGAAAAVPDWSKLSLPDGLRQRLQNAATEAGVTRLKKAIEELDALGPEGAALAETMRQAVREYDMDRILGLLKQL